MRFGTLTINRDSERKPVALSSRKNVEKKYDYYGASGKIDKIDNYLFDEKLLLIGEDGANLVTRSKPIAFFAEGQYWVNNHAHCIDATDKRYLNYLCYFINAINLEPYVTGSAQPKMNQENMNNILISLPPFKEQLQILNQIDLFYEAISSLENEQQGLVDLIGMTKSKILDFAIRGKLVPQDPDDEPASVLLERIRTQKEELIKQGKIKRDKKESVIFKGEDNSYYEKIGDSITDIADEIPFELPNYCVFVRFKDIWELLSGRDLAPCDYNDQCYGVPYITGASNFFNGSVVISRWTDSPQVITKLGDLLITCKGTVGEIAFNTIGDAHIARQIMAIRNIYNLNMEYLSLCISFYIEALKTAAKGLIPGISRDDILNLILPLPSEKYQAVVVYRVNELFEIVDYIEKSLS